MVVLQSALLTVDITEIVTCNVEPQAILLRAEDGTQVAIKNKENANMYYISFQNVSTPQISCVSLCPLFDTYV